MKDSRFTATAIAYGLLHKYKVNRCNQADEGCKVVPLQSLALEEEGCEYREDNQRDNLLHNLELHECKWTTIACETDTIGRNLARVLGKCDAPREEYHQPQGPRRDELHLLQLQVAIPGEGHKDIRNHEQQNCIECIHSE